MDKFISPTVNQKAGTRSVHQDYIATNINQIPNNDAFNANHIKSITTSDYVIYGGLIGLELESLLVFFILNLIREIIRIRLEDLVKRVIGLNLLQMVPVWEK